MRIISSQEINDILTPIKLIETLRTAFQSGITTPKRHHHTVPFPDAADATLLIMPAWTDFEKQGSSLGGYVGVKLVSVYPDNSSRFQKPSISGVYMLFDGKDGTPVACLDASSLTVQRTAAASALAADYLARKDASRLVMAGAGALSAYLVRAHVAVRPIEHITLWNRTRPKAEALAKDLADLGIEIVVSDDLAEPCEQADIISCATMAQNPIILGDWLKPGAHLDLVGAYRPDMRETDDVCVLRSDVYVDTRTGALSEGGDVVQAIDAGILSTEQVLGDLFDLCRGTAPGRKENDAITLFKSVGTALEDLAAAQLIYEHLLDKSPS
ncbi:MAG: ornithine cyclodeaminase family protein [Cohaesibacteraceae bacterium]|nr:ornithine cyclodeaminase family protein [Cohaesibacteraceae bacterium]